SELSEIDVGSWFNRRFPARARDEYARECVPTLRQVLSEIAPRCHTLYVELKCAPREACALAAATVEAIRECDATSRSIIESFELSAIREVKQLAPELRTAALFERRLTKPLPHPGKIVARALAVGADELALQRTLISRRIVRAATDAGLLVVVWTVDHPSWIGKAQQLGLHALITNHPSRLCAALVK
ncbi:MAG: glycerophosphodiester phosphodiesterase, partial [Acidobacteriota bacterium]|nr:glycerophosphodiester phosphodiesterase [Acidobacteriota bacterium]